MKRIVFCISLALALALAPANECNAQDFALSTNVLDYANFVTLNLQASYGVARHWSLNAGMKYNPFSYRDGLDMKMNKQVSCSVGAKFWPWYIFSGWWLSGAARYQEYSSGGIFSILTTEGNRIGGSLSGGYSHLLSPHLNLDFGIGLWAGYNQFKVYACQTCGKVVADGKGYFVLPSDITVALTYIF